jgi:hypothetical protein
MVDEKENSELSNIPKKDIFKAPDGYFDSLQARLDQRIKGKAEAKVIGLSVSKLKYIALAAAAAVAILIVFLPAKQTDSSSPSAADLISQISDEDCLAFLQSSDLEIDDLLNLSEPELWGDAIEGAIPDAASDLDDADADLLYERYGITPDENMQTL